MGDPFSPPPFISPTPVTGLSQTIIEYDYDPLYRLTAADYANGDYYHYTYDAVGNRVQQTNMVNGLSSTVDYAYDDANRLSSVNAVNYNWDNNGNLLNDGVNAYTYDSANRLKTMTGPSVAASYSYNGLNDRLQEIIGEQTTTFAMDYNTGLTQVLNDGTNNYIYGNERIAQVNTSTEYFLGDALGSVRQLTNTSGAITYASAYDPYGVTTQAYGASQTAYGYTGEYTDSYIKLIYLRSRLYDPASGRFTTRDSWQGDYNRPLSLNRWNYVEGNPVNYTDPSGQCIFTGVDTVACLIALAVGIPVIAGVATSAWDYYVTQGHGYGAINWNRPECTDWYQVLNAGKGGSLGALNSEGKTIASIALTPTYIMAYLVWGYTPTEVNQNILSAFGLDDEYRTALRNPYYYAGQKGGDAAMTYISLASFLKGISGIRITSTPVSVPSLQPGGLFTNRLILTLPGVEAIGGSGQLIYVGTAGMVPQFSPQASQLFGRGTGGGGQVHHVLSNKIFRALNNHPTLRGIFNRNDFLVRATGEPYHSGYQAWHRLYDEQVTSWLASNPNATRAEFIQYLRAIYSSPELRTAFPDALDIIR